MAIGPYLIVITKREKIGDVDGHTVWKVIDTEVLSFKRTLLHLTEQQVSERKIVHIYNSVCPITDYVNKEGDFKYQL